jgi:hypothetical protein
MAASGRAMTAEDRPEPALADHARKADATTDLVRDVDRSEVDHLANDGKHHSPCQN